MMLDLDTLMKDPQWSKCFNEDTWAEYEKPLDFSDWPIEWIKQVPKEVRMGKECSRIDHMMLTK